MHVTSGTTGEPVAIGLTARDHAANSRIGGEAFAIAGVRPDDVIAHCLNYALYAGGIADHMALEASGATVVPVGVGQSRAAARADPRAAASPRCSARCRYPGLPGAARRARPGSTRSGSACATSSPPASPAPGWRPCAREIESAWEATVRDTFGMSDVWSTMAGECGEGEGLHLTTGGHAVLEVVDPETRRAVVEPPGTDGRRRRASSCGRTCAARPRRCCATARATSAACGRRLRVRAHDAADPDRRPPRRHAARAGGQRLPAGDRRAARPRPRLGRWLVVAEGDPIEPPLRVFAEAGARASTPTRVAAGCTRRCARAFELARLDAGTLPVAEQKTRIVYRPARGDEPPRRAPMERR